MTYQQITERIAELTAEHAKHVTIVQTCRAQIDNSTHEAARLKGMIQGLQEAKNAMAPEQIDADIIPTFKDAPAHPAEPDGN